MTMKKIDTSRKNCPMFRKYVLESSSTLEYRLRTERHASPSGVPCAPSSRSWWPSLS